METMNVGPASGVFDPPNLQVTMSKAGFCKLCEVVPAGPPPILQGWSGRIVGGPTLNQKLDVPGECGDSGKPAGVPTGHPAVIDGDAAENRARLPMFCTR